jgi:phosphoenolpyruvate carboxykinase (ATP)
MTGARVYLVNTGWNGKGKRISLPNTRAIIDAILDGSILKARCEKLPFFDLDVPTSLPGVPSEVLDPRSSYEVADLWTGRAVQLVRAFNKNFEKFLSNDKCKALQEFGPKF